MLNKQAEHQPKTYYPEDITLNDGNPYLDVVIGQMALQLALKNVGSQEKPIWIAWFDPREKETKQAGSSALVEMLDRLDSVALAITPFSSKSIPMIQTACEEAELPLLQLFGGRDFDALQAELYDGDTIHEYYPITSPDKPKYVALGARNVRHVLAAVKRNEKVAIIDDVYSSGATIKAILAALQEELGEMYDASLFEVVTVAREGVLHNGQQVPEVSMEPNLTYDVFIPEVIGDLQAAVNAK